MTKLRQQFKYVEVEKLVLKGKLYQTYRIPAEITEEEFREKMYQWAPIDFDYELEWVSVEIDWPKDS
jgi:hypothetical protein